MKKTIWLVVCAGLGYTQTTVNGSRDYKGTLKASGSVSAVDFSGAAGTAPVKTGTVAARLSACTQGQVYFATDATAGQNLSFCTTTGTPGVWSPMTGGSGGSGAGVSYCAPAGGSATTYTCSPNPAVGSYAAGVTLAFVPDVNGAGGATTVNTSGLGARSIRQADGVANPAGTDLAAGKVYLLTYDGAVFRMGAVAASAVSSVAGRTGAVTLTSTDTGLGNVQNVNQTVAGNITSGTLAAARLPATVALTNATNTFTGYNDSSGGQWRPPESTVANLPAAAGATAKVFLVTDALGAGNCSAGAGTARELCRSNGINYECIGNCGGGGGGAGTPGGINGQMQFNSSGSFGGQPFVLNGSVFQRGVECSAGTVSYTSLTANAVAQEISIVTGVTAKFRLLHMILQEATQFASAGVGAVTVSAGRPGVDTDLIPGFALKSASAPQSFWFDRPGTPAVGTGTYDIVLQFVGSSALGNGTVSNFTAGSANWEVCGFAVL